MKLIVTPSALRPATREDLFGGEIYNVQGVQFIKDNTTVFYKNCEGILGGPFMLDHNAYFPEVFRNLVYGLIKILTSVPSEIKDEILFDLVLRTAEKDDFFDSRGDVKMNRVFYKYVDKKTIGPNYTDNSSVSENLKQMLDNNQLYVPHERQHFKSKAFKKSA